MQFFVAVIFAFFASAAFAQPSDYQNIKPPRQAPLPSVHDITINTASPNAFYFKPYFSIEYSAPVISGGGANVDFKTSKSFFSQMREFENLALGGHFRVQKYLGFNLNWAQSEMDNSSANNLPLSRKANFRMDHYNLSALFFVPVVEKSFELFGEVGAADMYSKIDYVQSNGNFVSDKAHETKAFLGAGAQINLNETSSLRISFQKYSGKLALLNSYYTTLRVGYLHAF